ncbi:MAG: peptidase M14 [Gammaproteobacteria bacterium]|nr:MAG: peptidase M14 [Gammaproteobacteria bacterium]
MVRILERLPLNLLETPARDLHRVLKGPTLIHLPGKRRLPLFISVLLHGNEETGWEAMRRLLARHAVLPRAVSLFIGNVEAAGLGQRRLAHQPDYNRIWLPGDAPEHLMARRVFDEMQRRGVFASIDIHNNTGINPHYACVNRLDHAYLHLAALFSRTVVYFTRPQGVLSAAFAGLAPSVTLECGQPGQPYGVRHALDYLEACLRLAEHPTHPVPSHDLDLYHSKAIIRVPEHHTLGIGGEEADIRLVPDLDHLNFTELPPATLIGWSRQARLEVFDEEGREVGWRYFSYENGEIRTRVPLMPSMFTLDKRIIRQDCLGYVMERCDLEERQDRLSQRRA